MSDLRNQYERRCQTPKRFVESFGVYTCGKSKSGTAFTDAWSAGYDGYSVQYKKRFPEVYKNAMAFLKDENIFEVAVGASKTHRLPALKPMVTEQRPLGRDSTKLVKNDKTEEQVMAGNYKLCNLQ